MAPTDGLAHSSGRRVMALMCPWYQRVRCLRRRRGSVRPCCETKAPVVEVTDQPCTARLMPRSRSSVSESDHGRAPTVSRVDRRVNWPLPPRLTDPVATLPNWLNALSPQNSRSWSRSAQ